MKVYRRSTDVGGVTCDKLKAYHAFNGVTAKVCPGGAETSAILKMQSFLNALTGNDRLLLRPGREVGVGE